MNFKSFLLEYLTPGERAKWSKHQMTPKARSDTDHYFGVGNDRVWQTLDVAQKSEVHKAVEHHIGHELSVDDYRAGSFTNERGNPTRISRRIKDKDLQQQFNQDSTRNNKASDANQFYTTTHRGVEVAGQTNGTKTTTHPKGHSWAGDSCKNQKNGSNKHYLQHEIKHGTVVHFVHDHDGKEIYRATLQPHHNEEGHVAYALDSEYGQITPRHTDSALKAASELSTPGANTKDLYHKHREVYNDNKVNATIHPSASEKDLMGLIKSTGTSQDTLRASISHRNFGTKHIDAVLNSKHADPYYTDVALSKRPELTHAHITKLIKRKFGAASVIQHPNFDRVKHTDAIINSGDRDVISALATSSGKPEHITSKHVAKMMQHVSNGVREHAASSPAATPSQLSKMLADKDDRTRAAVLRNANVTPSIVKAALDSDHIDVARLAAGHRLASSSVITKALKHPDEAVRRTASSNPNVDVAHLNHIISSDETALHSNVAGHPKLNSRHIDKLLSSPSEHIRRTVARREDLSDKHMMAIAKGSDEVAHSVLASRDDLPSHVVHHMLDNVSDVNKISLMSGHKSNIKPEHIEKAMASGNDTLKRVAASHVNATTEQRNRK